MFMDLLRQELGASKTAAGETRFKCPFCGDGKHRFYVDNDEGIWICFKCDERGNPVSFVMNYYNVDYMEAVDILAGFDYDVSNKGDYRSLNQYGADLSEEEKLLMFVIHQGEPPKREIFTSYKCPSPPTNCKSLIANFNNPEAFPFFGYLMGRGVTLEQIETHHICYVTNGEVELVDGRKLILNNHVVFFTFDDKRKPLYWNTRSIEDSPFIKSFNAPSRIDEYSKNNTIFNLNNANNTDKIVVAEGVFNALTIGQSGVATFGKQITDEQAKMLIEKTRGNRLPIYLWLDTDAWVQMIKTANKLHSLDPNRNIYFVYTGTEEDANDLGPDLCKEYMGNAFLADSEGQMRLRMMNL